MEFACSHVVCNWRPGGAASTGVSALPQYDNRVPVKQKEAGFSVVQPQYDNKVAAKRQDGPLPPPLPPRLKKSLLSPPLPTFPFSPTYPSRPPPVPPRVDLMKEKCTLTANVNVVSISIGKLVTIRQEASDSESFESPVACEKCSAALSQLSFIQKKVWLCEFCGCKNSVSNSVRRMFASQTSGVYSNELYRSNQCENDYQNLEDTLVVFCVDISGSMSVTTEVTSINGSQAYKSRLEGVQDALKRALSSLLEQSPNSRVALVTFNDEVVIYGDGTRAPLTLRDWALVDYDHIWQQGVAYNIPHCIAETFHHLTQRVNNLSEHGATSLGPAVLASVAVASRYPGSKVILCTDGRANVGLGRIEESPSLSSHTPYFYKQLAEQAVNSGIIISVMTFEGTDCCLADIGRLADCTGGRVNMVSIGTVAAEIQLASSDNVLATQVMATLFAPDGVYFPYEDENHHKLVRDIGNVTKGLEITFQFAVKPQFMDVFLQRDLVPFQLQLSFKTRDQQKFTRVITEKRPVTTCSQLWPGSLNMAVLGVHCAQLCARLTMEGRVQEAQRQLKAQQDLLSQVSEQRPIQKEEITYTNWMDTLTVICDDITMESQSLSDEAAKIIYQMKRASSVKSNSSPSTDMRWKKK